MNWFSKQSFAWFARIYIAGDFKITEKICSDFCTIGLCVTIEPTRYIFTGGFSDGVVVGMINYPKYPRTKKELEKIAIHLGDSRGSESPDRLFYNYANKNNLSLNNEKMI